MSRTVLTGRAGAPGVGVGWPLSIDAPAAQKPGTTGAVPHAAEPFDATAGQERLRLALETATAELEALAVTTTASAGDEIGAIFEAQALFARDPGIVDPTLERIAAGQDPSDAILDITEAQAEALSEVDDEYFRERAADVRDVGRRVAAILRGVARPDLWHPDGRMAVLVGTDVDPSAVAALRPGLVAGIALAGGAPTGHAAIVARALGIPLVLGLGSALDGLDAAAEVAVDGFAGRLIIHPSADDRRARPHISSPSQVDGLDLRGVRVVANVASPAEAELAAAAGAEGIGLVRTELLFLGRTRPPSVAEQRGTYARILSAMGDRPVVFRTLDVGGDKPAIWHSAPPEANPALGVRGIRLGQRVPGLLDDQLRALLEAAEGRALRIMLPMIATREELDDVRARLAAIRAGMEARGIATPAVDLGVMIEIPAAAIMADRLAESADFFSIGTNDLVQYALAADRTNPELADLASPLQPAVLRLIDGVVRAAAARHRHVAVCGEAAADPSVIPILVGLGVRELSVSPSSIGSVRATVAGLDPEAGRRLAAAALAASTLAEVRALLD